MSSQRGRICVFLHDLRGGGAERINLLLVEGMLRSGRNVDLVLVREAGEFLSDIPQGARVFVLKKRRVIQSIFAFSRYLRRERPTAVVSSLSHVNIAAILAVWLSRLKVSLVVCEHNQITQRIQVAKGAIGRLTFRAISVLYPRAKAIVAVSKACADDLIAFAGLDGRSVKVIYNPVYDETMRDKAGADPTHPWLLSREFPTILAIGRLHKQKGFDILLHAFQQVRKNRVCRLIIVGEGEDRSDLESLSRSLGIEEDVSLPGFIANPYALMARADLFVLSSRWEGLPTVLIEALACGATVLATDCPGGSREILEDGRYGTLVPANNPEILSAAILKALDGPRQPHAERANDFTISASVARYLELLEN